MNGASPAHTLVSTTTVASGQWKQWRRRWFRRFPFFTGYSLYARAKRRNYAWDMSRLRNNFAFNCLFEKDHVMDLFFYDGVVLKADLMAKLDKEVKALEEDSIRACPLQVILLDASFRIKCLV
ncbi:hypothetical protein ARALYDRAFT_910744 [Arabidopsis lyrata subsp. lyrata]|uniref:Uncharacterized protein n=1 Tax=Arabidopsis lyrata subsp. lyrata TaxID=81972 RepID=D7M5D1_ARALL|nr:hypothetical protein ARALYDRAFT_910744 [Arabidopsis lyrata subsp. lyrata]